MSASSPSLTSIRAALRSATCPTYAQSLQRFFKTGPGEYGEGDVFLGARMPDLRKLARTYCSASARSVISLLRSRFHEERLLALLILIRQYERGDTAERERIYRTYRSYTSYINNWDLVDVSAPHIVGAHLADRDRTPLRTLIRSPLLWERRIALLATFYFIRGGEFDDTLALAGMVLTDEEDLIHKAAGWMLREVGNRDRPVEEAFLKQHYRVMPRTMLRYAIEKFDKPTRQRYLHRSSA